MMTKTIVPVKPTELKPFTQRSFPALHTKQHSSLSDAVSGVIASGSLMVTALLKKGITACNRV